MTETQKPDLTTPGDDTSPTEPKKTARGNRYRVLGKGEGDHCVYEITPQGSNIPSGSLVPIPGVPQFTSAAESLRWVRAEKTDLLAGKQLMIFQAHEILTCQIENKPRVVINRKPKTLITSTETEEGAK